MCPETEVQVYLGQPSPPSCIDPKGARRASVGGSGLHVPSIKTAGSTCAEHFCNPLEINKNQGLGLSAGSDPSRWLQIPSKFLHFPLKYFSGPASGSPESAKSTSGWLDLDWPDKSPQSSTKSPQSSKIASLPKIR